MNHPADARKSATDTHDVDRPVKLQGDTRLQERLSAILDEYLTLLESGDAVDDEQFLQTHDELADELRPHLHNLRAMHGVLGAAHSTGGSDGVYQAPQQLGVYTLIREIGRGGQGIVYEAVDQTLNRRVALKVLPFAALLDRKQIDRFNNEAQAAARLHHPNIVPVYAVGVDRGVHFYAMQYIEGAPLSVAIGQLKSSSETGDEAPVEAAGSTGRPVSTQTKQPVSSWIKSYATASAGYRADADHFRQVARLGIETAAGLSHAHEIGIVHRDIKPSNLLLDERGKIWIADFGLARIPNDLSMTGTGDVLGTARYMSPEQARGSNAYVDHRTDVYSLGVTLYELLTLKPAFEVEDREAFMQQIGTREPPPPRRLNPAIPVDLENIILRAIEIEPSDRYESAEQLGEDLQRFLDGRPTLARRSSLSDRCFKWAKRHRRMVATVTMGLILLAAGLATATFLIAREQQRTAAALDQKDASYRQAKANFEAARQIVDQLGVQTSESLVNIPGAEHARRELLLKTKHFYDYLLTQSDDPSLYRDRGVTLAKSGNIAEQLGDIRQAIELYQEARSELQHMATRFPGNDAYRSELLNCINNEAMLLARTGQLDLATSKLSTAVETQQNLLARTPENLQLAGDLATSQANLAYVLERSQELDRSKLAYEAAIRLYRQLIQENGDDDICFKQRRQLALVLHNLSSLESAYDRIRSRSLSEEAIHLQKQLLVERPDLPSLESELAISHDRRAELLFLDGRVAQAEQAYEQAIRMQRRLVASAPGRIGYREDLAITQNHLGDLYRESGSFEKARNVFAEAADLLTAMVELAPAEPAFRSSLGAVLYNQGSVLIELDERDAALEVWNEGLLHQRAAVESAPTVKRFRRFLDQQEASLQEAFPDLSIQK